MAKKAKKELKRTLKEKRSEEKSITRKKLKNSKA